MKRLWQGLPDLEPLLVPIDNITSLPGNPRRGDIEAVAESLQRFGQRKPVVARRTSLPTGAKHDEKKGIAEAGNHVRAAAHSLGWTHVAVVFADEDEDTGNAYAVADNRTHDLGYDDLGDLLAMLDGLDARGLLEGTGWDDSDVAGLRAELNPLSSTTTNRAEAAPQALWPVVRLLVEPEVHKAWTKMWIDLAGATDTEKIQTLLTYTDYAKEHFE